MKNMMLNFLKGVAIGAGAIAPGVSGGAIAVILGIYEKITYAIGNIFRDFRKSLTYLMPYGSGAITGVLVFSNIFKYLFIYYNVEIRYLFVGLMAGTFPSLFKKANKNGFRKEYIILLIVAFLITSLLSVMENSVNSSISDKDFSVFQLILYGVIIGVGTIIPGVSSSVILIYLGSYEVLLDALASLKIFMLIPVGIGFVICFLLLSKAISMLFDRVYGYTYYAILGFVVGSIIPIFPGFNLDIRHIISLAIMLIGLWASYYLSRFEKE